MHKLEGMLGSSSNCEFWNILRLKTWVCNIRPQEKKKSLNNMVSPVFLVWNYKWNWNEEFVVWHNKSVPKIILASAHLLSSSCKLLLSEWWNKKHNYQLSNIDIFSDMFPFTLLWGKYKWVSLDYYDSLV